jgi:hypothetical protein
MPNKPKKFDPEGPRYDYEGARKAKLGPDKTDHWPSRDPKSGIIFKGAGHKSFIKTQIGEMEAGNETYKGKDGRYYTRPINYRRSSQEKKPPEPPVVNTGPHAKTPATKPVRPRRK